MNRDRIITMKDLRKQHVCVEGSINFCKYHNYPISLYDVARGKVTVGILLDLNNYLTTNFVENLDVN